MAGHRDERSCRIVLALCALVTLALDAAAQEGKLDRVSEETRDGDSDEKIDWDDVFDDDWDDDSGGLWVADPLGTLVDFTILLPFFVPRALLADGTHDAARYQPFPYRDGPGYWLRPEGLPSEQKISSRVAAEFGKDFDDLERVGFGLRLEHENRFGIDIAWSRWREDLSAGGTDQLDLADLNLVYRFAQGESAAFRAGLGMNWLDDELGHETGINFTYGADFLPVRPLTAGFEFDLGTLGDATQTHFRGTLGFVLERFELYASFDHYDIDDAELRSYGLGLRGWF